MSHLAAITSTLVSIILPVFGLILIGHLLVRFRFVDGAGTKGVTSVIFWALLPALLFLSLINTQSSPDLPTVCLYFGVALPIFVVSIFGGLSVLHMTVGQASVFGLNAAYGNTVMLGIPIVNAIWGNAGLSVLLSIIAAHSLLLLPAATVMVEFDGGENRRPVAMVVRDAIVASFKNPVISSILAAAVWRWSGIPVPEVFRRGLELLAQAAPALSLIGLGASLPVLRRSKMRPPVLVAVAIKLVVMPLCMALAVGLAAIPTPASTIMILTAALPTGANAFLLAHRSGAMMEVSAATVVVSTLLAVGTLTTILAVLN